jgi:hypothetical protein
MGRVIFQEVIDDLIEYAWVVGFMVSLPLAIFLWRKFNQWRLRRFAAGNELESPYEAFYKSETEYLREGLSELLTVTRFGGFWVRASRRFVFFSVARRFLTWPPIF